MHGFFGPTLVCLPDGIYTVFQGFFLSLQRLSSPVQI